MAKKNRLVRNLVVILFVAAISMYLFPITHQDPLSKSEKIETCDKSLPSKNQQKLALKRTRQPSGDYYEKVTALEKKITTLNTVIEGLQDELKLQSLGTPLNSEDDIEISKQDVPIEDLVDPEEKNQDKFAIELEQRLAFESYDTTWAESLENQLNNIFSEQPQLEGNELFEVSCRTTLCRVEIGHHDENAESELISTIAKNNDLMNNIDDFFAYRILGDESTSEIPHSVFFIARKGYKL